MQERLAAGGHDMEGNGGARVSWRGDGGMWGHRTSRRQRRGHRLAREQRQTADTQGEGLDGVQLLSAAEIDDTQGAGCS